MMHSTATAVLLLCCPPELAIEDGLVGQTEGRPTREKGKANTYRGGGCFRSRGPRGIKFQPSLSHEALLVPRHSKLLVPFNAFFFSLSLEKRVASGPRAGSKSDSSFRVVRCGVAHCWSGRRLSSRLFCLGKVAGEGSRSKFYSRYRSPRYRQQQTAAAVSSFYWNVVIRYRRCESGRRRL